MSLFYHKHGHLRHFVKYGTMGGYGDIIMRKNESIPEVAPPTSYKAPSLPTLAALGVITATAALTAGCKNERYTQGDFLPGIYIGHTSPPIEKSDSFPLRGLSAVFPVENDPENIPESGVGILRGESLTTDED